MPKPKKVDEIPETENVGAAVQSEKQKLLYLYNQLKELKVNSISDLENLIARA